jgi:4-oxalocrotonate tautomerase
MPLVRISLSETVSQRRQTALADAVHSAMVATINVPETDRFQIITRYAPTDLIIDPTFPALTRSQESAIVHITLRKGRTNDQKRALYAAIILKAEAEGSFSKADIMIVLSENDLIDWSFGAGIANYLLEG